MSETRLVIGHASISENGTINGKPGDSTGKEVYRRTWYNAGWTSVLRPTHSSLASNSAKIMEQACDNDAIGYSQYGSVGRNSLWNEAKLVNYQVSKITTLCNCDCSSLVNVCVSIGSRNSSDVSNIDYVGFSTGNMRSVLRNTGYYKELKDAMYLNSDKYLRRGDILYKPGHTAMVLLNGVYSGDENYAMEDANTSLESTLVFMQSLYDEQVTKADAILREVGYLDSTTFEPSINSSGISLSVINYTNLLGDLFTMYVPEGVYNNMSSSVDVNVDNIDNTKAKSTIMYLMGKGLNAAASCGVTANIKHESNFNTGAIGDNGTSFGICQWHLGRGSAMKQMVGSNWATNLSGQLDYLFFELTYKYKSVLSALQSVPNTLDGAKSAADVFVRKFEIPANVDFQSLKRQATAEEYWSKIVVQQVRAV